MQGRGGAMSIESYIPGDPRMSIDANIKEQCLDKIRDAFREDGINADASDIVILAISIFRDSKKYSIDDIKCIDSIAKNDGKTQILNYKRMGDEHLAFLYAESISELGIEKGIDFAVASKKWEEWAEEGLKMFYCNYFEPLHNPLHRPEFFDKIYGLATKS